MTEFEIWQLYDLHQRTITDQFQFWMATTFAVVIASYTAGHRLAAWARLAIALIYVVAATLFYVRYVGASDLLSEISQRLADGEFTQPTGLIPSVMRRAVMISGSLLACVLILMPTIASRSNDGKG